MVRAGHSSTLSRDPVRISPTSFVVRRGSPPVGSLAYEKKDDTATNIATPEATKRLLTLPPSAVIVSSRLFSGFLEHLGRCIYGGVVNDPDEPSPASLLSPLHHDTTHRQTSGAQQLQIRKDVLSELAKEMGVKPREWKSLSVEGRRERPLLRWPGGNYVSNYHWQDGIGPLAQRKKRIELAWGGTESNLFGTDDFIEYCHVLGVEPYVCLNMGTGTMEEALAWLEYCNGTGDTYWANLRRKNSGRDEPYCIKYWGLGNEVWAEWQVGRMDATEYTRVASRWSHALKLVDPTIVLVSCGKEGGCEWDWTVLKGLTGIVDMHSIHYYTMLGHQKHMRSDEHDGDNDEVDIFGSYEKNVFGAAAGEQYISVCAHLIDMAEMETYVAKPLEGLRDAVAGRTRAPIGICLDEWNVWDDHKATPQRGLEQIYDYTDMLGTVAWLHVLVRNTARVQIACLAQSVNVLSPLLTNSTSTMRQVTYYPISLFAKHFSNGALLSIAPRTDIYEGPTYPAWVQQCARPTYVDIVAILNPTTGNIHISLLNRHPTITFNAPILFDKNYTVKSLEAHTMYSDDLLAKNTFENPHTVIPSKEKISAADWKNAGGIYAIRPHSWSLLLFEGQLQATM